MTTAPFTVYDIISGEVLRTGRASDDDALLQAAGDGEAVTLDTLDAETQYLPGGVVTNRPAQAFSKLDHRRRGHRRGGAGDPRRLHRDHRRRGLRGRGQR